MNLSILSILEALFNAREAFGVFLNRIWLHFAVCQEIRNEFVGFDCKFVIFWICFDVLRPKTKVVIED